MELTMQNFSLETFFFVGNLQFSVLAEEFIQFLVFHSFCAYPNKVI